MKTLFVGGTRSGKSSLALRYAESLGDRRLFVATAIANDLETEARILAHKAERGNNWQTLEKPDFANTFPLEQIKPFFDADVILLDCLTFWLNNLFSQEKNTVQIEQAMANLILFIRQCSVPLVIVTSEIGQGVVPTSMLVRQFRDLLGLLNQRVAAVCDNVVMVSCGLPLTIKGQVTF